MVCQGSKVDPAHYAKITEELAPLLRSSRLAQIPSHTSDGDLFCILVWLLVDQRLIGGVCAPPPPNPHTHISIACLCLLAVLHTRQGRLLHILPGAICIVVCCSDQDLHLSYLALELCTATLGNYPDAVKQVEATVLSRVVTLLRSQLLQGHALEVYCGAKFCLCK